MQYKIDEINASQLTNYLEVTERDGVLIDTFDVNSTYNQAEDTIELHVYSLDNELIYSEHNYKGAKQSINAAGAGKEGASVVSIDPEKDAIRVGYEYGGVRLCYNFLRNVYKIPTVELSSFYIESISNDRLEVRLVSLEVPNDVVIRGTSVIKNGIDNLPNQAFFNLNLQENRILSAVNIATEDYKDKKAVLVRLYEPLPEDVLEKTLLSISIKKSDSVAFEVSAQVEEEPVRFKTLRSANFDLELENSVDNPTEFFNYAELFSFPVTSSYYELRSLYNEKSAQVSIDHSNYSNFIHFSSAEERLRNFDYKLRLIENYELKASETGSLTQLTAEYYETLIKGVVDNFDHYDRFLYYESSSNAWPKLNSNRPYTNQASTSSEVVTWYENQLIEASIHDRDNEDILINTVPAYIKEDSTNEPYLNFIHMIGQHFDNVWIYARAISDKYNADNRLEFGISRDLVKTAIEGFGIKIHETGQNLDDFFSIYTSNAYDEGNEQLTDIHTITSGSASEYLQPMPKENYRKEIYKRIYHNLPLLTKAKGTERGLRALIACYGIPDELLDIKLSGGGKKEGDSLRGTQTEYTSSLGKIRTDNTGSVIEGNTLSLHTTVLKNGKEYTNDKHTVEVGFNINKPVDEYVKQHISSSFNIDNYIGDPRQSGASSYKELAKEHQSITMKITEYNLFNFIRLLKFFDNSLFRTIREFIPARSNMNTGVILKPSILDRSKAKTVSVSSTEMELTGSIDMVRTSGNHGGAYGSIEEYITSHNREVSTYIGMLVREDHAHEEAKFNGELKNSGIVVTDGELNRANPFKRPTAPLVLFDLTFFSEIPQDCGMAMILTTEVPTLTASWNILKIVYRRTLAVTTDTTNVRLSQDGKKVYTVTTSPNELKQFTLQTPWSIDTAGKPQNISTAIVDSSVTGLKLSATGDKMFILGESRDRVYEYSLQTAWDITSANYTTGRYFYIGNEDFSAIGIEISPNGTSLYIMGDERKRIVTYTLQTAWDITSAIKQITQYSVYAQDALVAGVEFSTDGSKMFIIGQQFNKVNSYTLSTPWDVKSATFQNSYTVVSSGQRALTFSTDGLYMYSLSSSTVYRYVLTEAWNILTATWNGSYPVMDYQGYVTDIKFSYDGTKLYTIDGYGPEAIITTPVNAWNIIPISSSTVDEINNHEAPGGLYISPDGTRLYTVDYSLDRVLQYTLSTPWTIASRGAIVNTLSLDTIENTPRDITFSPDGLNMYIAGCNNKGSNSDVTQFKLTTAWNISTAYIPGYFNIAALSKGFTFDAIGSTLYNIVDVNNAEKIDVYTLPTNYSTAGAILSGSVLINDVESSPKGIKFSDDGLNMYILGTGKVTQCTSATPWNLQEMLNRNLDSFNSAEHTTVYSIAFSENGLYMYVSGQVGTSNRLYQYTLTNPWDTSTASTVGYISLNAASTGKITISTDGLTLNVAGISIWTIYRYVLGTAWTISSVTTSGYTYIGNVTELAFSSDGTKMYTVYNTVLTQYTLSTAWNAGSTRTLVKSAVLNSGYGLQDITLSANGDRLYIVTTSNLIVQYALSTPWDIATATYRTLITVSAQSTSIGSITFSYNGETLYVNSLAPSPDIVNIYNLSTPWEIITSDSVNPFIDLSLIDISPTGIDFSSNGEKLFLSGDQTDKVYELPLATAWDITSYTELPKTLTIGEQEPNIRYAAFVSTDGDFLYTAGNSANIQQYNLTIPHDIPTAVYSGSLNVAPYTKVEDLYFNNDGTHMYISNTVSRDIAHYELSTAWKLSTATYLDKYEVPLGITLDGNKVTLSTVGDKFYISQEYNKVSEFLLQKSWELSTAEFVGVKLVSTQTSNIKGMDFRPDGSKFYLLGGSQGKVFEYQGVY